MPTLMTRFIKNRAGSAATEFALIGALVCIAIISALALLTDSGSERRASVAPSFQQTTPNQ